jgi:hypothetical protein
MEIEELISQKPSLIFDVIKKLANNENNRENKAGEFLFEKK